MIIGNSTLHASNLHITKIRMSASKPLRTVRQDNEHDAIAALTEMRNNNDVCRVQQQHDQQQQQQQQQQHDLTTKKVNQKSVIKTRKMIIRRRFVLPTKTTAAAKINAARHHHNVHQEQPQHEDKHAEDEDEKEQTNRQSLNFTEHQQNKQGIYCDSNSVDRIGHPKIKRDSCSSSVAAAALLLINTAATSSTIGNEDQHRAVPKKAKPQQEAIPSDEAHYTAMRAAQGVYYKRMIDAHARHQQGHFAMMFPQQREAAQATMISDQEPIRQQQQQQLLQQPQHATDSSFNSMNRQLSPIPTNPAADNIAPPRFVGNFYFAQEEKLSGTTVPNVRHHFVDGSNVQQLRHLLTPQERHLTTQFTASIIDQLDFVYFEEGDRRSHRTHLPIGFRGIRCRHCKAPAGKCGRFFPSSLKTLSDTQKTLYTLHRHFIKCQHVPDDVIRMLHKQRENHMEERKTLKGHGSQRAFFRGIWAFLCPEAEGGSIAFNESDKTK